jgi:response regulator RpfG family c-di-GMP phosphodiesterase
MHEKILLVDDEPAILQGYQRLLRNDFQTETAVGARGALIAVETKGPYAVVVSDMRMPEMDGIQFLSKLKTMAPDTIRIMLTGNADLETAVAAVNEGSLFRFLTKPCSKEAMGKTLTAGLVQYRLVTAEKDLLENTLRGSIGVLTEVLSLVNPAAFGRALRLRRYMGHVVSAMGLPSPWRFEVAAMMSQLGCVTLHPETIEAVNEGRKLSPDEQARYRDHPKIAHDLLRNIPRLEPIAWMIAHQNEFFSVEGDVASRESADMRLGAEILQAILQFDDFLSQGYSRTEAAHEASRCHKELDPRVFRALVEVEVEREARKIQECTIDDLVVGMIFENEVRTQNGMLIVSRGQEITAPLLLKLKSFWDKGALQDNFSVTIPHSGQSLKRAGSA